ncbi:hypothetical protein [Synechococcus sp. PCC 7335]|uniref:hypothetical protein n=1 Tax=Synechococcus sp. (strain ATCC 29403 / PCC 7335) TaxID=91464 RepID=UPI0012FC90B7|nr:hypothetical protein [Synechococcus sp. PCC 7335]
MQSQKPEVVQRLAHNAWQWLKKYDRQWVRDRAGMKGGRVSKEDAQAYIDDITIDVAKRRAFHEAWMKPGRRQKRVTGKGRTRRKQRQILRLPNDMKKEGTFPTGTEPLEQEDSQKARELALSTEMEEAEQTKLGGRGTEATEGIPVVTGMRKACILIRAFWEERKSYKEKAFRFLLRMRGNSILFEDRGRADVVAVLVDEEGGVIRRRGTVLDWDEIGQGLEARRGDRPPEEYVKALIGMATGETEPEDEYELFAACVMACDAKRTIRGYLKELKATATKVERADRMTEVFNRANPHYSFAATKGRRAGEKWTTDPK